MPDGGESELDMFCFGEKVDVSYGPLAGPRETTVFSIE